MTVDMSTFGEMLMSRPAGREAFLGASAYLFRDLKDNDIVSLDFAKVKVLAPSWADEFITGLKSNFHVKIEYKNTDNESVSASLKTVLEPLDVTKYQRAI